MTAPAVPALDWLLASREPVIRGMARRDLLGEPEPSDLQHVLDGAIVQALLADQQSDGGFGDHPYRKWTGAHWRLVSLTELEVPPGEPRCVAAAETVLGWLTGPSHQAAIRSIKGLVRRCASQEGNALAVCCLLGMADDPRVRLLATSLVEWQWPDGGWNCDPRATGRRSSFNETLAPMWGLHEYALVTGDGAAAEAAHRAAELFLDHRVYRSLQSGEPIHSRVMLTRYPPYWHYEILQALHILARMGRAGDERAADAIDVLVEQQLPDGRWQPTGSWWRLPGSSSYPEAVDWGRSGPSEMITLNALRVLDAAGRRS